MWRKSIDSYITILPLDHDWICGMKICDASREFYIFNVYLPYESHSNTEIYHEYLAILASLVDEIMYCW